MIDIIERLRFDATRCELQFSKGVAGNIEDAAAEIERLRSWAPMDTAPKDGSWIIGLCHDRVTMIRVSWGRDRKGELYWCSTENSYGEGMFCGWKPFGNAGALHR